MNITLNNQTGNAAVREACELFMNYYKDPKFLKILKTYWFFVNPFVTGNKIADQVLGDLSQITIVLNECQDEECPTNASTLEKRITWHRHDLMNPVPSLTKRVATLMHEYMHTLGYKHIKNGRNFLNNHTAPYKVARIFVSFLEKEGKLTKSLNG